jgi:hypothetical protein
LNLASGGVCIGNFGTYPLILQGVTSISTPLQTLTSSWSTVNTISPHQALVNSTTQYGLNPSKLPTSYYLMINGSKCVHVDAILALQDAILARPDYHEAYNNRGVVLQLIGNHFDALLCHENAFRIKEMSDYLTKKHSDFSELIPSDVYKKRSLYLKKIKISGPIVELRCFNCLPNWR